MIFNLVEAAQEFLSEIAPANDSTSMVSQSFHGYLGPLCLSLDF